MRIYINRPFGDTIGTKIYHRAKCYQVLSCFSDLSKALYCLAKSACLFNINTFSILRLCWRSMSFSTPSCSFCLERDSIVARSDYEKSSTTTLQLIECLCKILAQIWLLVQVWLAQVWLSTRKVDNYIYICVFGYINRAFIVSTL